MYRKDAVTQNVELEGPEDKCQLQKEPHAKRQVQTAKTSGEDLTSGEGQHISSVQMWYNLSQVYSTLMYVPLISFLKKIGLL